MIRSNEAMLLLKTSAPTFYKRVKKLGIELVVKIDSTGKASFIREEDLEELSRAMGKTLQQKATQSKQRTSKVEEPEIPNPDIELLKEINELKIEKTTLSSKVEEFSWYVELYKQQLTTRENRVTELESERTNLYSQIIKTQVSKSTYQVLFFAILVVVTLTAILFGFNIIQLGVN